MKTTVLRLIIVLLFVAMSIGSVEAVFAEPNYPWMQDQTFTNPMTKQQPSSLINSAADTKNNDYTFSHSSESSGDPTFTDRQGLATITDDVVAGPMALIRTVMSNICYALGFALVVIGLFQCRSHRRNPQEVPLSVVILTLTIGIILLLLPFSYSILQVLDPKGY